MKPLHADEIVGNWATLLLPINSDESIDYHRLKDEIAVLIESHPNGIYSNGTAGEFYAQSEDEFDRISLMLAEECEANNIPFQIGASHMSAQISLERIRRTKQLQPSAFQVILPDWHPLTDDEMVDFLSHMAEVADPIGLVLYNPPRAKRVLAPPTLAKIADAVPNLLGVKVADGDEAWYQQMQAHVPQLSLFVPGHHLATGYQYGASGAYSNVACLNPKGAQRWYELMLTDLPQALEIETRIRAFMTQYIEPYIVKQGYANQAVDKLLAVIGGWADVGTRLRFPYRFIQAEDALALRPIAHEMLPELFES